MEKCKQFFSRLSAFLFKNNLNKARVEIIQRDKKGAKQKENSSSDPKKSNKSAFSIALFIILLTFTVKPQWQFMGNPGFKNTLYFDGVNLFSGDNTGVTRSTDDGTNWSYENTGITTTEVRAFTTSGNSIFCATFSGGIYKSSNGPTWNWSLVQPGSFHCLRSSGSTLLAGSVGGGVYLSNDNGVTWATSNSGLGNLTVWYIYQMGADIYCGTLGGVFKSTDVGASWVAVNNGITSLDVRGITSSGIYLFAGSIGGGVFRSSDAGNSWSHVMNGGDVYSLTALCNGDVYAGLTNMGGIARSTDHGITWLADNNGLSNPTIAALVPNNSYLFAATGNGIFRKSYECPVISSCITWDLLQSGGVTSASPGMNGTGEIIGAGSAAPFMSVFPPYIPQGQRLWCGNSGWVAGSIDPARFIEFKVTPFPGGTITINQVSFNYGDNPLPNDFNILNSEVYFSTDGWQTSTQLGGILSYLNTSMQNFSQTIPGGATLANGDTFSLRIFPYAPNGSSAMTPSFAIHNNVTFCGTASGSGSTLCDSLFASAVGSATDCSFAVSLANNSSNIFTNVEFELISGGMFSNVSTPQPGWGFTNITPNNKVNLVSIPSSAGIGQGTFNNVLNLKLENNSSGNQQIIVKWMQNCLEICRDTIDLNCSGTALGDSCSAFIFDTVICRVTGLKLVYQIQNNSNVTASGYSITPTTPGAYFPKTMFNTPIAPGQTLPKDTLVFYGVNPNETICIQTAIYTSPPQMPGFPPQNDTIYNLLCRTDTICIPVSCPTTDIGSESVLPQYSELMQNYPNPFNPVTTIDFSIAEAGNVNITLYDLLGREVEVLVNEEKSAGKYSLKLDATNLNSGIYFCRMRTNNFTDTKKLILLK